MTGTSRAAELSYITVPLDVCIVVVPFAVGHERPHIEILRDADDRVVRPTQPLEPGESPGENATRIANFAVKIAPDYLKQLYTFSIPEPPVMAVIAYFAVLSTESRERLTTLGGATLHDAEHLAAPAVVAQGFVEYARTRLRAKCCYSNVASHLVPGAFTLSHLQEMFESVVRHQLNKRNLRRRVRSSRLLKAVRSIRASGHQPNALVRFAGGDPQVGPRTPKESDWSA